MRNNPNSIRERVPTPLSLCAALWLMSWPLQLPAQSNVYVYPAGCFDAYGRPMNPDPANPSNSADPACQPPSSGALIRGSRSGSAAAPARGGPSMQSGSINLPPTPVPVPGGMGVMNP